eukprot:augustus_masked-scaffold_7-processed-gene-6.56-mRNA-1 protein AED:0.26 eAED:0.26 QI:0/-1/0/1/-1/1/1/0/293
MLTVLQTCCSNSTKQNLSKWTELVRNAAKTGSNFICLPEAFDFIGVPGKGEGLKYASSLDGELMSSYKELAKKNNVWLSLGGFHESLPQEIPQNKNKFANLHCLVNSQGEIVAKYRKIHMFDTEHDGGYRESKNTLRGDELVVVKNTPVGTVGLAICYDLRFPELFNKLCKQGKDARCDVILVPSAFMPTTGKAHWHTLLRARAIENQCYIAASAQAGKHNEKRSSFGHSLIVDPWGTVLVDLKDELDTFGSVVLDKTKIAKVRNDLPVFSQPGLKDFTVAVVDGENGTESKF